MCEAALTTRHTHLASPHPPPQMPFYNAVLATPYVKATLGPYYLSDPTPIPLALWRTWATCKFIDPADGGIMYCHADDGRGAGGAKAA